MALHLNRREVWAEGDRPRVFICRYRAPLLFGAGLHGGHVVGEEKMLNTVACCGIAGLFHSGVVVEDVGEASGIGGDQSREVVHEVRAQNGLYLYVCIAAEVV